MHLDRTGGTSQLGSDDWPSQRRFLNRILDSVTACVCYVDREMVIRHCNAAAAAELRVPAEQVIGLPLEQVVEQNRQLLDSVQQALSSGTTVPARTISVNWRDRPREEDGQRHYMVSFSPDVDDGEVQGGLISAQDVTEVVQAREQAEQAARQMRELDRRKDEFFSLVSHELRNPLSTMKGYTSFLLRRLSSVPDGDALSHPVLAIDRQIAKLTGLVADLLDVSRIELGKLTINPERMDLVGLVRTCAIEAQQSTSAHRITLQAHLESLHGQWDPMRMEQVLGNLLENAIHYSPAGGRITVVVGLEDGQAAVHVCDDGVGIEPQELEQVFDRFYRGAAASHARSGLGIGLYVVKGIVEAHGGTIEVESEPLNGTTFRIRLPLNKP